ncbi:hypothetical protein ACLB2K_018647 [Fragaria x ananassa]
MIRWSPPPFDRVKINFDDSVWRNSAAGGFVIRTPNGNPLVAASSNFGITTISVAEALSLRNSLICAKERGLSRVEVEGDSKLVIDAVNGIAASPWRILKLVQEIRCLRNSFDFISFKHIFRETNFVANAVANVGHKVGDVRFWEECVPPEASLALSFDYVNRDFVANAVANVGHKVGDVRFWEECVPPEASLAMSFDYVNRGCVRGTFI